MQPVRPPTSRVLGCSSKRLRNNIETLFKENLLDSESKDWWDDYLKRQDNTDWSATGGEQP